MQFVFGRIVPSLEGMGKLVFKRISKFYEGRDHAWPTIGCLDDVQLDEISAWEEGGLDCWDGILGE